MTCPQCKNTVPAGSLWTVHGLSAITCPNCRFCLCPTPISAILLFAVSFGLAEVALLLLRKAGAGMWPSLAAFFLVFAAAFVLLAPLTVQLRMKERRSQPRLTDRKA